MDPDYPSRFHHSQSNGVVVRPSSNAQQRERQVMEPPIGPPPAYNEQQSNFGGIGNGSVGVPSSFIRERDRERAERDRERDSGDFQNPMLDQPPRVHPRDRGDTNSNSNISIQRPERTSAITNNSRDLENAVPKMVKIAVVGDSTVGKTSICQAVTLDNYNFNKNYHLTCGVKIYTKGIKLPDDEQQKEEQVNMVLVDSSGKDIYTDSLPKYWGKLDGVLLVLDLSSKSSLQNAAQWLHLAQKSIRSSNPKEASSSSEENSRIAGIVLGNKMDIPPERRIVSSKTAQEFATKHSLKYFECSVKESSGLEEPFLYLGQAWAAGLLGISQSGSSTRAND